MSKRKIKSALKARGIECLVLEYTWQASPGDMVAGWDIQLTEECEELIAEAAPDFDEFQPDCSNTTEVLAWVDTLPTLPKKPRVSKTKFIGVAHCWFVRDHGFHVFKIDAENMKDARVQADAWAYRAEQESGVHRWAATVIALTENERKCNCELTWKERITGVSS